MINGGRGWSRTIAIVVAGIVSAALACEAEVEGVPEGALARVGEVVIEQAQVEAAHTQLDAFGQARFRGPHGRRALIDALIEQELLVQEAREAGYGEDPRVDWAVLEELAALQHDAMLERRLPRAEVAADVEALRARYEREVQRAASSEEDSPYLQPERRRLRVVRVDTWDQGEQAIEQIRAGELSLEDYAAQLETPAAPRPVLETPLMRRDEREYPAYHSILFDPALGVGDLLPSPVLSGQVVLIGVIAEIEPSAPLPFEDPEVQERLVTAERAQRLVPVEAELLEELAARFEAG